MSNKNVTLPQLQKSVSNVKNYIDYNNILTTLTSNDGCIPYRLVLTEEEIDDSYNKTITSTSISKDMFEEIYNSAECIEIWIKNNDETTNSGHDFFYETGYISGSYGTNNGLRKKIFSKKIFDPIFKASGNRCNYLKINYIFEEQEDSTITLKTEHLRSISYNIDLFPIIRFENDNNEYIAVYDLKNALYLSNINLSDTDGLILKTDIKNIDLYNIYGNNCIVSCSVENNNVSLILPDRIIKGEIKSKTSIILSNTTEILFSDDIKKYVDDKVASLVDSAPKTLDTLKELSTALGDDPNFATTMATTLGNKVDKVDGKTLSTNDLTNELKANYDAAYTHSQSSHFDGNYNSLSNIPTDLVKISDADSKYAPINSPNFTTSVSMGRKANTTIGTNSVALGSTVEASGNYSHAEGYTTNAYGNYSHTEGNQTKAYNDASHAEGTGTIAKYGSHVEGLGSQATGSICHAEGYNTKAIGDYSHTEGQLTTANGNLSHAEGIGSTTNGNCSHAEGSGTQTGINAESAHAEGNSTKANGKQSHSEGYYTIASGDNQHVQGKYNIEDISNRYVHIVGNGTSSVRSNAHTLDWNGNGWYQGKLSQDGTPTEDKDLTTKKYVDDRFVNINIASTLWNQNVDNGLYELTYTHNLATENISVQVYNTDSKYEMFVDTQIVDANNIKITSDENPNCAIRIVKF